MEKPNDLELNEIISLINLISVYFQDPDYGIFHEAIEQYFGRIQHKLIDMKKYIIQTKYTIRKNDN